MAKKLWGGRFKKKIDEDFEKFSSSISYDYKLAKFDVLNSLIHIFVLKKAGILSQNECNRLRKALNEIKISIENGIYTPNAKAEDIHTDIQEKVEKKVGNLALKLQTCRSRNDQIVFDTKMFCKISLDNLIKSRLDLLVRSISDYASKHQKVLMPGYTHMQHAQVMRFADYMLAYVDMFIEDSKRLASVEDRIDISMGSGAFAGTMIDKIKYDAAAKKFIEMLKPKVENLSFSTPKSAISNVSDRAFVIEILSAIAILGMHLSRMAEDFIIWTSKEFDFIEIGDEFCTGSSLMPQKKNPDALELIRGNTGRLYGNLISVLVMMKGLPLSYNRDMQLDKEPLFDSFNIISKEVKILVKLIKSIKLNKKNIEKQLGDESLYATDLADFLVFKKVPFKQAHDIIGRLVRYSIDKNRNIRDMSDIELKKFSAYLNQKEIKKRLNPEFSVNLKRSYRRKKLG